MDTTSSELDAAAYSWIYSNCQSYGYIPRYPAAKAAASRHKDRGAMRACVWGEKVERIIQALLDRYEKEGESFLEGNDVWVCSVCGFVYIGENPPSICPVCKVPDWKFGKIV